ncbi:MAG TPA: hypothetical protein EYQ21_04905 [Flavobacteriales bacterium]|nr:hypothetical protein [Flavobacteriales bacterium]
MSGIVLCFEGLTKGLTIVGFVFIIQSEAINKEKLMSKYKLKKVRRKDETRGRPTLKPGSGRTRETNPSKQSWEIIELLALGNKMATIAREYKVSRQWIFQIRNRWKHKIYEVQMQAVHSDRVERERIKKLYVKALKDAHIMKKGDR